MRSIGLHIRKNSSLLDVQYKIDELHLSVCQMFVVSHQTGKLCSFSRNEIQRFAHFAEHTLDRLYIHGSYWINLASLVHNGHRALMREFALAKRLSATHFIIHPGTAKGTNERTKGIDALARVINSLVKVEHDITIVLENTAHGNLAVGSDLHDFFMLRQKLDIPERVKFCIDTAHAYAFGYDIGNILYHDQFISQLDQYIGLDAIELIHLNDTKELCGSKIDCHAIPGTGNIGSTALIQLCNDIRLADKPIVLELPVLKPDKEGEIFTKIVKKMYAHVT